MKLLRLFFFGLLSLWLAEYNLPVHAQPQVASGIPIPGLLLVKFTPESPAGRLAEELFRTGRVPKESLNRLARDLSEALEAPLAVDQVTSGREFVLRVLEQPLTTAVVNCLKAVDGVKHVVAQDFPQADGPPRGNPIIAVEFLPESPLVRMLQEPGGQAQLAGKLTTALESEAIGLRLIAAAPAKTPSTQVFEIDLPSVTEGLLLKIRQRSDVEYAQRSYLFQHFGPAAD
jgi:hypothetical protein